MQCEKQCIGKILPETEWEQNSSAELHFKATEIPFVQIGIENKRIILNLKGIVSLMKRRPTQEILYLFTISVDLKFPVRLIVNAGKTLQATVGFPEFETTFLHGPLRLPPATFNNFFRGLCSTYFLPKINDIGLIGVSLPLPNGISIINSAIEIQENFFLIKGDLLQL